MGILNLSKKMCESMTKANGLMLSIGLLEKEAKTQCMAFLESALAANDNEIDFHEYDEFGCQVDDKSFCVPYDGGAHPEYASNVFSDVNSVYIYYPENSKKGRIYLNIEDCDEYPIENIDDRTFCELCQYIFDNLS